VSAGERRIPLGPLVGTIGAVMLAVSLFLDWWEGVTGFTAFEVLDLVLLALAVLTALALLAEAGRRLPVAMQGGRALPPALLALAIVLVQLVNDPPLVVGPGPGHDTGIWLALAGSVLMSAGALVTASRISLAVDVRRREPAKRDPAEAETQRPDEGS
jgi:hypothetical protein